MDDYTVHVDVRGIGIDFDRRKVDSMAFVHTMKKLMKSLDSTEEELPIFDIDELAEMMFGPEQWERMLKQLGDIGIVDGCAFILEALNVLKKASEDVKN